MVMHLWWNFDLKKIKRKLGYQQHKYKAVPQIATDEEDRPLVSPPSIVYGSYREENQFVLEFPVRDDMQSSPVLLAREPLLFDINFSYDYT